MLPDAQSARTSNPAGHLEIGVRATGEQATVTLEGELDLAVASEVTKAVEGVAASSTAVLLDIEGVTFMDSAGLRCVLLCERICREAGAAFRMTPASPRIRRLFGVAGLLDWLPSADSDPPAEA
jgi:anti-anti-sigma factor